MSELVLMLPSLVETLKNDVLTTQTKQEVMEDEVKVIFPQLTDVQKEEIINSKIIGIM